MTPTAKVIFLMLSIITPPGKKDIDAPPQEMKDLPSCWDAAREFTERDLSEDMRAKGILGFRAGCGYMERPSEQN